MNVGRPIAFLISGQMHHKFTNNNQSLQTISKPNPARRILLIILKNKPWKKIKPGYSLFSYQSMAIGIKYPLLYLYMHRISKDNFLCNTSKIRMFNPYKA